MITTSPKALGLITKMSRVGRNTAPSPTEGTTQLGAMAAKDATQHVYMPPFCHLFTDTLGNYRALPIHGVMSTFNQLPNATSIAAAKDPDFVTLSSGTIVTTRATKGGVNIKTPSGAANGDTAILTTVANDGSIVPLNAPTMPRFATRVSLTQSVKQLFSATLDQTFTSVDPTASSGDGAGFIFDPTGAIILGTNNGGNTPSLIAASETNWIMFQKIAGVNIFADTGVAVVAGVDYDLEVAYDQTLTPSFLLNGALVGGPAITGSPFAAGTAAATVAPLIGVKIIDAGSPAQHDVDIRFVSVERFIG